MLVLSPMLNVSSPFAVVSVRVFADASTLLIVPLTVAAVAFATRAAAAGAAMMLTAPRPRLAAIAAARKLTFIVRLLLATHRCGQDVCQGLGCRPGALGAGFPLKTGEHKG